MSKYLRGKKRLQVIHNWLHGRDDPVYEVFPTASEEKYIVTKRANANESLTPNNEILDKIKQIGDEIKSNRNKNEQEKMIKKKVKKQMSRQNKYPHAQALNSSASQQVIDEPQKIRPYPRSRIFKDIK